MQYYYNNKISRTPDAESSTPPKKTATPRLTSLLRGVIRTVKKSTSELALIKLDLAKKRMAREKPEDITGVRYMRAARTGLAVEYFYERMPFTIVVRKHLRARSLPSP